ncbi:MAG: HAMP domain-containing protein [Opitutales bacterium]|nr:HAMP domain-containing protein [Opitutales bacterium]
MKRRRRLRGELIRSAVLTTTITLLIFMAGSLLYLRYTLKGAIDGQLRDIGGDILSQQNFAGGLRVNERIRLYRTLFDEQNLIRLIEVNLGGEDGLYSDPRMEDLLLAFRNKVLEEEARLGDCLVDPLVTVWHGGRNWRVGTFSGAGASVVLATDLADLEKPLVQILLAFLFALPLTVLGAAYASHWYGRRISGPIEDLARHASDLTASNLTRRIALERAPMEVGELEEALNLMTERLEKSFQQARRFSADASHELRTPLTVMQGILENRLQEKDGLLSRTEADQLLQSTQRLAAIVEGLLLLARADEGTLLQEREIFDSGSLLRRVAEDAEVLAESAGVEFFYEAPSLPPVGGDPKLLEIALHNLLKNALQNTPAKGRVTLRAYAGATELVVTVENSGKPIPRESWEVIFKRFARLSGDYAGMGLGLNLVAAIARSHGGSVRLVRSDADLTVFRLSLPLVQRV